MKVKIVLSMVVLALAAMAGSTGAQIELVKINFQPVTAQVPAGYLADTGAAFGDRGNGFSYGWDIAVNETRERNSANSPDKRYDTLNHMQKTVGRYWEIALPAGTYDLFLVCGDPSNTDQTNTLDVEGILVPDPDGQDNFDEYTVTEVSVTDGRLTIKPGTGASNAKLCFIDIFVKDPTFNPAPVVSAGADQSMYVGGSVQLSGVVTDAPPQQGDPGVLSWFWQKYSGPGTVTFSDNTALDATATFNTKGVYELLLQATDGDKDANDVMIVTVKARADEFLVGYWNFEDNVLDQSINNNHGTIVSLGGGGTYDLDAAIGAKSINLIDTNLVDGEPNTNYVDLGAAPEMDFGTGSWTVTGWFKTTQTGTADANKGNIYSKGGDNTNGIRYTLGINEVTSGAMSVTTDDNVAKVQATSTSANLNDGRWHFAAGVRDGGVIRVYVDGLLQRTTALPAGYNLSGTSQTKAYIGVGVNFANGPTYVYKHLNGLVDDVRVYNYALPLTDAPQYVSVRTLTAMGPVIANVDAGADVNLNWRPGAKAALDGAVTDYGRPTPTTIMWSTEPGAPGEAQFDDPTSPVTMVSFPTDGVYVLKLTVIDEGLTIVDMITATVNAPTCADVIATGKALVGDISGPDLKGTPDCRVDLFDFARMADDWIRCNDPGAAECEYPY